MFLPMLQTLTRNEGAEERKGGLRSEMNLVFFSNFIQVGYHFVV
jgi:hypothetical protein